MKTKMGMMMFVLAALLVAVAPARAQEESPCRCVDADGNPIERCTCFRMPDVEGMLARLELERGRPRLGISLDPAQGASRDAEGVLVRDVMEGGPAEQAGLRAGDVITSLNGASLVASLGAEAERDFDLDESAPVQRLMAILRDVEPGADVQVEYLRDGRRQTTSVQAADLPGRRGRAAPWVDVDELRDRMRVLAPGRGAVEWFGGGARDGLALVELNAGLGAYFGVGEGVLVANVDADTPLGLRPGDVVTAIGGRVVSTPDRFRRILSSYGEEENIDFELVRDGDRRSVTGRLGS